MIASHEARVRAVAPQLAFTPEDLRAVTGLLAGEGVLYPLPYGGLIVLQPSWLNGYASTLVKLAGEAENQLGHVPLAIIQPGKLPDDGSPRLAPEDEQQLLPHRHRPAALGTVQLAGCEITKLLGHVGVKAISRGPRPCV